MPTLSSKEKIALAIQRFICFLAFLLLYPLAWVWFSSVMRYHVPHLKTIRQSFKKIAQEPYPILICPNHLTFVDSLVLILIFNSYWGYLRHFNTFAWNFPKLEHIKSNWLYRFIIYVGKCVSLDFQGTSDDVQSPMRKASFLLAQHEFPMIFAEGQRTKGARIDSKDFAYGVGKLIRDVPHTRVLCVYLRGHLQKTKSDFPPRGSRFYCHFTCIQPQTEARGLRAMRDLASQVIQTLVQLEEHYFSSAHDLF